MVIAFLIPCSCAGTLILGIWDMKRQKGRLDMGAQNKRFRAIRNMNSLEESRSLMQEEIDSEKDIEEQPKIWQFQYLFTLAARNYYI